MEPEIEESTRDANRRMRSARRWDKLMQAWRSRGLGTGEEILAEAVARWPGQWDRQLRFLFDMVPLVQGRRRPKPATDAVREAFYSEIFTILNSLRLANVVIRDLDEFGRHEVLTVIPFWIVKGLSAGTIQDKLSNLRRFFILTGQPEVIPVHGAFVAILEQAGIDPSRLIRVQARPADYWLRRRQIEDHRNGI